MSEQGRRNPLMELLLEQDYKKVGPTQVLREIYDIVENTEHSYARQNWEILVEVLADHLHLTKTRHREVKKKVEARGLFKMYLKTSEHDRWDHLGQLMTELEIGNKGLGQHITPKPIVQLITMMLMGEEPTKFESVLDPCVGTGGFLLAATNLYPAAPLVLYGIEIDPSIYRACLVNMKLFSNHFYYILCGDALRLPPYSNSPMWRLANKWDSPDLSLFYGPYRREEKGFSLKDYVKQQRLEQTAVEPTISPSKAFRLVVMRHLRRA